MTESDLPDEDLPDEDLPEAEFYDASQWENDPEEGFGHSPLIPSVDHGPMQVWFRNANEYTDVLRSHPYNLWAFTVSDLRRKRFHPYPLLSKLLPSAMNFEWVTINQRVILHHTREGWERKDEPIRIPTWAYGRDPQELIRLCRNAEKHGYDRIGVGFLPRQQPSEQNRTLEWLYRLGAEYENIKFHYTLGSSWRHMFGLNFASTDFNPSYTAKFNNIWLPNGLCRNRRAFQKHLKWIHVLGFSVQELTSYENRVRFNMASALWAAEHYREAIPLSKVQKREQGDPLGLLTPNRGNATLTRAQRMRRPTVAQKMAHPTFDPDVYPQTSPDLDEPYHMTEPIEGAPLIPVKPKTDTSGDRILCNSCSLAPTCHVYREGAICAVPTSPTSRLATVFGTRDTEMIKGALAEILSKQVERYERSAERFREDEESDVMDLKRSAHLLKMETSLVRSTETFMKILDPSFRESNIPAIQNNTMHVYNPNVLVANVVKQLEEKGIDRSSLTPELIQQAIDAQPRVIEG